MQVITELTAEEIQENAKKRIFADKQRKLAIRSKKLDINRTSAERAFLTQLKKTGLNYKFQKGFITSSLFAIADFYFPDYNTVVEIDGEYHNSGKQKFKDFYRTKYLNSRDIKVIRITNKEAFNITSAGINNLIRGCADGRY